MASIFRRTVGILGQAVLLGVALIEEHLDTVGSGRTNEELLRDLHEARIRGGELAMKVAKLEDQCTEYRYMLAQNPQASHFGEDIEDVLRHIHGPAVHEDYCESSVQAEYCGCKTKDDRDIPF